MALNLQDKEMICQQKSTKKPYRARSCEKIPPALFLVIPTKVGIQYFQDVMK
jgi:hypothetical protein